MECADSKIRCSAARAGHEHSATGVQLDNCRQTASTGHISMQSDDTYWPGSHHHLASSGWYRPRELRNAGQILVDTCGTGSPFSDCPDNQRLTAAGVAAHKHAIHIGGVVLVSRHVATFIERHAKLRDDCVRFR